MPITIANLKKNRSSATIEFLGETAEVIYKPSEFTPELESEAASVEKDKIGEFLVTVLSRLIESWDVTSEDGTQYEPTPENLSKLQVDFLAAVLKGIGESIRVNQDDRKN